MLFIMGTYQLQLLGGFSLDSQDESISISSKKAKALLAFLALHANQSFSRDRLANLLWEDSDTTQARQSLRQSLAVIRKVLPNAKNGLIAEGDMICLSSEVVSVDAVEFEQWIKEGTPEQLECGIRLFKGDLLEGFNPKAAQFDDWLMLEQSRIRELALHAMQQLLNHYCSLGKFEPAIQLALRYLNLDPLQESMHRTLMQLYVQVNKLAAALKQFRACKTVLSRELQINPDADTVALYRDILKRRDQEPSSKEPVTALQSVELQVDGLPDVHLIEKEHFLRHLTFCITRITPKQNTLSVSDTEQFAVSMQNALQKIETITCQQGGLYFQSLTGQAISVFGLPVCYSDDLLRAFETAKHILDSESDFQHSTLTLGMASGKIYVEKENQQYRFFGAAVSLAEQLACFANGNKLLVCDDIAQNLKFMGVQLCEKQFQVTENHPCWQVEHFQFHSESLPMVGRQKERLLFSGVIEECLFIEKAQALLVRGEAGIGKSRLVEEYIAQGKANDFLAITVACRHFGEESSNDVLAQLSQLILSTEDDPVPTNEELNGYDWLPAQQLYFLKFLLGLDLNETEQAYLSELETREFHRGLCQTVYTMLANKVKQQPLLIVIEDIHWAKTHALLDMAELLNCISELPIIVIMTSRLEGDALDPNWRSKIVHTPLLTLDLNPLHKREAGELAEQLDVKELEILERCVDRAQGNPLFLQQLLLAGERGAEDLPDSIQNIILARVDQFTKQEQLVLQSAAVLGDKIELDALKFMVENSTPALEKTVQDRILVEHPDHFTFFHALFRESIYLSLLDSTRKALHEKAAGWYQNRNTAIYAYHLAQANDPKAQGIYFQAATTLQEHNRSDEALELIKQALQLTPSDLHDQLQLLCLHGEVLRHLGQTLESEKVLRQAITLCGVPKGDSGENTILCKLSLELADTLRVRSAIEEALEFLNRAEQLNYPLNEFLQARIHYLRGSILFPLGRLDECMREHRLSLEYATKTDSSVLQARAYSGLGDAYYQRGQLLTACKHFQEAVSIAESAGFPSIQSVNLSMCALIYYFNDQLETAKSLSQKALSLAQESHFLRGELLTRDVMANMISLWDELGDMDLNIAVAESLAKQLGARGIFLDVQCFKAFNLYLKGDQQAAEQLLLETYEQCEPSQLSFLGPMLLGIWAMVARDEQQRQWALMEGQKILATHDCVSHNYLFFYHSAIQVCLEHSMMDMAHQFAEALALYIKSEPLKSSQRWISSVRK